MICKTLIIKLMLFLLWITGADAQFVTFYPIEIYFNPVGYTNLIPGEQPDDYSTFSSVRLILDKDLPSFGNFANTISLFGSVERYHSITAANDFYPLSLNPVLKSFWFAHPLVTPGVEINTNYDFLPYFNSNGNIERASNFRVRARPFMYVFLTPNLFFNSKFTYGRSIYSKPNAMNVGFSEVPMTNPDGSTVYDDFGSPKMTLYPEIEMIRNDYSIYRYDLETVYLLPFFTQLFISPYVFYNTYDELPARSADGSFKTDNPPLRERGFGAAVGMRTHSFRWGYGDGVFEYEKNFDDVFGHNSYHKLRFSTRWENQYFTERFGYRLLFDYTRHLSSHEVIGFSPETNEPETLGATEIRGDMTMIFNLNRNVSIRPQYDFIYREFPQDRTMSKSRYWLNLHVIY
ncbi:hypothetical protein CHISP_0516 [Chitinispirillum alkaliphilum]|nr:hypothetical protein CHISP_0516 [Chitinispirillum alkaliphilum]